MTTHENWIALVGGVASHLCYFKRGEKHEYPWRYAYGLVLLAGSIVVVKSVHQDCSIRSILGAGAEAIALSATYILGLYSSLLVYRLCFNPLNKFPGPLLARVTKLYHVYLNANLLGHHELERLHQQYGPYVRIGPNDLSVVDPDGMSIILGSNSKCRKSAWYGQDKPYISTNTTRDRAAHDKRRRVLSPAFSDKALRGYETQIQCFHNLLIERIRERVGSPMDVTQWFGMHGFDMMGDLVFGRSFGMLESGELHEAIELMGQGLQLQGYALPPWLYRVCARLPLPGSGGSRRFGALACQQVDERLSQHGKTTRWDMMQPLLEHFQHLSPADQKAALPLLQGDSRMLIVAGSDTTSTTMINLFYHLAKEDGLVDRLRDEVAALVPDLGHITYQQLRTARLLHGCIDETLRLHYPAPSGFFRKTPKEGVQIGSVHVPADTIIQLPPHVMAQGKPRKIREVETDSNRRILTDESIYPDARAFIPERWSTRPDLLKRKDAFLPFLAGSESCIGKNLAYIQLAVLTSQIIMQFDVKFAPGEDGSRLVNESKDLAMLHAAKLVLVFSERSQ